MRQNYFREVSPIAISRINLGRCPVCDKPKSMWSRRIDWTCCSIECTETYYKEFDKSYSWEQFRYDVFKRDNGVCAMCGVQHLKQSLIGPGMTPDESKLIADHIIPIELGGGMWDKSNIQTLCIGCNKIKTRVDMGNIAVHRRRFKKRLYTLRNDHVLIEPFVCQQTL